MVTTAVNPMPSGTAPGGNIFSVGTAISIGGSPALAFSVCGFDSPCGRSAALTFRICAPCAVCVRAAPVASSGRAGRPAACRCMVRAEIARGEPSSARQRLEALAARHGASRQTLRWVPEFPRCDDAGASTTLLSRQRPQSRSPQSPRAPAFVSRCHPEGSGSQRFEGSLFVLPLRAQGLAFAPEWPEQSSRKRHRERKALRAESFCRG